MARAAVRPEQVGGVWHVRPSGRRWAVFRKRGGRAGVGRCLAHAVVGLWAPAGEQR